MDKEREAGMDMSPDKDEKIAALNEIIREQQNTIRQQVEDVTKLCNRVEYLEKQLAEASWNAEVERYYYESQPKETW